MKGIDAAPGSSGERLCGPFSGRTGDATVIVCMVLPEPAAVPSPRQRPWEALFNPGHDQAGLSERSGGGYYRGGIGAGPDYTSQRPHDYRRFSVQSFGEQIIHGRDDPRDFDRACLHRVTTILARRERIPILPKATFKERIDSVKTGIWAVLAR